MNQMTSWLNMSDWLLACYAMAVTVISLAGFILLYLASKKLMSVQPNMK